MSEVHVCGGVERTLSDEISQTETSSCHFKGSFVGVLALSHLLELVSSIHVPPPQPCLPSRARAALLSLRSGELAEPG